MKVIQTSGSRKRAVARATLRAGKGNVTVNSKPLSAFEPELSRRKIEEGLLLAGKLAEKYDIAIDINGGGMNGQAEAARLAVSRALAEAGGDKVKQIYLDYDRNFLVADVRRKEQSKPNSQGKARAKRQKSYR